MATPASLNELGFFNDPRTARQRYILRSRVYAVAFIGFFAVAVLAIALSPWHLLGVFFDLVFIPGLTILFITLCRQAITLRCPYCGCFVRTDSPWLCSSATHCKNRNPKTFPFITHCEHCGVQPIGYQCGGCGKVIPLTNEDEPKTWAAYLPPEPPPPPIIPREDESVTRAREIEQKRHQIRLAELDQRHEAILRELARQMEKPLTPAEEATISYERSIEKSACYLRLRERAEVTFANNPEMLKRALAIIKQGELDQEESRNQ